MPGLKIMLADGEVKVGDTCFHLDASDDVKEIGPIECLYMDGPTEEWFLCAGNQFYQPRHCWKTRDGAVAQALKELDFQRKSLERQLWIVRERIARYQK